MGHFVSNNNQSQSSSRCFFRHFDEAVRAFVVKRIQAWAQTTQIAAYIHTEDIIFHQRSDFYFFLILKIIFVV